jgi:hypothetical protein
MGLYFLTHLSLAFKQKYFAGFISLSGNFAGQGLLPAAFVEGLSLVDLDFYLPSVNVLRGWPANYMSSSQPAVFSGPNSMVFFQTNLPPRKFFVMEDDYDTFFRLVCCTRFFFFELTFFRISNRQIFESCYLKEFLCLFLISPITPLAW